MEDRGCSIDLLKELYEKQNKTKVYLRKRFNVTEGVLNRWFMIANIKQRDGKNKKYTFNENTFNVIDSENKAYWLGFLWCDGYVSYREKKSEYVTKLELSNKDEIHLYKFKAFLKSTHPIHTYSSKRWDKELFSCRLMISNKQMGKTLMENYGLIPHRKHVSKVLLSVPKELHRHFFRGVFDAEGSLTDYLNNGIHRKVGMSICTYKELIDKFQLFLIENGLRENAIKTSKRHPDRDAHAVTLDLSGRQQVIKVMSYLYEGATIYLDRKYEKFKEIQLEREIKCTN